MQIVAIIEKGADGFYSIRSEQKVGRYCFAGINESRMRASKIGIAYPGEKTTRKVMKALEAMRK